MRQVEDIPRLILAICVVAFVKDVITLPRTIDRA